MENEEEVLEKIDDMLVNKKINELHEYIETINSADFPSIFEKIENEDKLIIFFRLLPKGKAAEVFTELDSDMQEQLINFLTDKEIKNVMNELYMDDAVDLIEEMPANVVKRILSNTKVEDRKVINELLKYPDKTAGAMMTTEFIDLKERMTVGEAFESINKRKLKKETVYNCYVLAADRKLLGVVDLKDLLISDRDISIKEIMDTNIVKVFTLEDQEEVTKMFDKYDAIALPVVDKEDRLVGIITVDDAIDVLKQETQEDFEKMAAISPSEDTYLKTKVRTHAKNRFLWLLFLMFSSMVTGTILEKYETAISTLPLLVAFIPLLMDTAGNCGAQSSTLVIRGLAMDEIAIKDYLKVIWKELQVSLIVATILAVVNTLRIMIQYNDIKVALVVSGTLVVTVISAKLIGGILPILAKKLKLDPAIMAAPILTSVCDTIAVMVYFSIVTSVFGI